MTLSGATGLGIFDPSLSRDPDTGRLWMSYSSVLVEKNGKTYLIVTPVDTTSGDRYNGCRVYEFTDINSNQLRRNNGKLVEVARIDGEANTHNGACDAYGELEGGVLLSQLGAERTANSFKIYKSQVSLP